ncbi:MAG: hypothetical protein LH610_07620 [Sphingomonas bacterium]|nr:hypothetical protein [Sphingomonas bacterium]
MISTASVILVAGCSGNPAGAPEEIDDRAIEQATHGSYVAAISSNDVDTLMSNLTDDIVYQAPGAWRAGSLLARRRSRLGSRAILADTGLNGKKRRSDSPQAPTVPLSATPANRPIDLRQKVVR